MTARRGVARGAFAICALTTTVVLGAEEAGKAAYFGVHDLSAFQHMDDAPKFGRLGAIAPAVAEPAYHPPAQVAAATPPSQRDWGGHYNDGMDGGAAGLQQATGGGLAAHLAT